MEIEIKGNKFWLLENKTDEKNAKRWVYDDEKSAINRLKELMKTVNVENLVLSSIEVSGKDWKIGSVPWSVIAMGLARGEK